MPEELQVTSGGTNARIAAGGAGDARGTGDGELRARVLVCDDSASMRAFVHEVLAPAHDVVLAETGEDAIRLARAATPDVVLCDLLLPGLSGEEVLRLFRADPVLAPVPFVIMTVRSDRESRALGLEAGADDYLGKPVQRRELVARVGSLVRLRRAMLALEERSAMLAAANRRCQATRAALIRAERLATLGTLAAGIAHAVNNPLAYVKSGAGALWAALGELEAAARTLAGPHAPPGGAAALAEALAETQGIAEDVRDGLRRIERVTTDLRFFAAPRGAGDELVCAEDAVRAAWDVARGRVAAAPRLRLVAECLPPILTSTKLLFQALLGILEHALSASGPAGEVSVRVAARDDGVEVTVDDDGPPLDASVLTRLFEGYAVGAGGASGPGLGLAVAQAIAHGLGGELEGTPRSGAGSSLRLWLPRRRPTTDA